MASLASPALSAVAASAAAPRSRAAPRRAAAAAPAGRRSTRLGASDDPRDDPALYAETIGVRGTIEKKLGAELTPSILIVDDDSEKHANHKAGGPWRTRIQLDVVFNTCLHFGARTGSLTSVRVLVLTDPAPRGCMTGTSACAATRATSASSSSRTPST
jgi:hypothetical protein